MVHCVCWLLSRRPKFIALTEQAPLARVDSLGV